jgi:hypothetical protein
MASASHPKVIIYMTPTCPDCWTIHNFYSLATMKSRGHKVRAPIPANAE